MSLPSLRIDLAAVPVDRTLSRPSRTPIVLYVLDPSMNRWAILTVSLRDEQQLVQLAYKARR